MWYLSSSESVSTHLLFSFGSSLCLKSEDPLMSPTKSQNWLFLENYKEKTKTADLVSQSDMPKDWVGIEDAVCKQKCALSSGNRWIINNNQIGSQANWVVKFFSYYKSVRKIYRFLRMADSLLLLLQVEARKIHIVVFCKKNKPMKITWFRSSTTISGTRWFLNICSIRYIWVCLRNNNFCLQSVFHCGFT